MGGEGSGGPRSGKPGATYSNRSDLSGDSSHAPGVTREAVRESTPNSAPMIAPGQVTPLSAGTERPDEPLTAGLPIGEGPGMEALAPGAVADDALWELRALANRFPNRDLLRLIAHAEREL